MKNINIEELRNVIYCDANATTFPDQDILAEISKLSYGLNPSSPHKAGRLALNIVTSAKKAICTSLNLDNNIYDIIFTSSGTESNNQAIIGNQDENIITSRIEHKSILEAAKASGKKIHFVNILSNGLIDLNNFSEICEELKDQKSLVSIIYANNETGVIQDIEKIGKITEKYNFNLHIDAAQIYGKIKFNIPKNTSSIMLTGHKTYAIPGSSCLIFNKNYNLDPIIHGGGQQKGYRSGTENIYAIFSLGLVAEKIDSYIKEYETTEKLRDYFEEQLKLNLDYSPSVIHDTKIKRLPNTSLLWMKNIAYDLQLILFDMNNIAVSSGSASSSTTLKDSYVLQEMNMPQEIIKTSIRFSFLKNFTKKEADYLVNVWMKIYEKNSF